MLFYKIFPFYLRHKYVSYITRWCKGKTKERIISRFKDKIHLSYSIDKESFYLEVELKRATIQCIFKNDFCIESNFFSNSDKNIFDFPKSLTDELREGKYATRKETINPNLFGEYDITNFTMNEWKGLQSFIVRRVIERGSITDFYALIHKYSYDEVVKTIRNDIDTFSNVECLRLASKLFDIPEKEMYAFKKQGKYLQP